jgi:hypothetical protein
MFLRLVAEEFKRDKKRKISPTISLSALEPVLFSSALASAALPASPDGSAARLATK